MPRSAHVACRHRIGVDIFFFDQAVGNAIRTRRIVGADQIALRTIRTVGAAVEIKLDVLRYQQAVALDAGLDLDYGAVTRIARGKLFAVIDQELYWPARRLCQGIAERYVV